jgi:very-short-patch-repair endonuclease
MNRNISTINARRMRKNLTDAEKKLWRYLRLRNIGGNKFRRQQSIGKYIVDFVCLEKKLIVEVDGGQHSENVAYDSERTAWLESEGYRVLRFWNNEVLEDVEAVLEVIVMALNESELYHPDPDPVLGYATLGQMEMGRAALVDWRPIARSLAIVPSREREA